MYTLSGSACLRMRKSFPLYYTVCTWSSNFANHVVSRFYGYTTHNKLCNQLAAVKMTLPSCVHLIVRVTQFADDVTIYGRIFGEVCNVPGMLVHFDACTDSVWQALSSRPPRGPGDELTHAVVHLATNQLTHTNHMLYRYATLVQ